METSAPTATVLLAVKRCSYCHELKSVDEFYRNRSKRDGLQCRCKRCHAIDREGKRAADRRYAAKDRARVVARVKAWREMNPERYRAQVRRHGAAREARKRARRTGAVGTATTGQLQARWTYYGGRCWMCGGQADGWDHVIALSLGGPNWPSNMRPSCRSCNSWKKERPLSALRWDDRGRPVKYQRAKGVA